MRTLSLALTLLAALAAAGAREARASDWPQFMRDAAHTGDAADEALALPLGLVAQVKLDDAVMASPAVVGGLVYVVDQMGTAYCVDPRAGRIVWKVSPDGEKAMGSNTSSPCVAKGRMYYGTTAGTFHVLDCKDGKVVKTVAVGWPVPGAPTFANDRIYFQALDSVVRCLDLDGNEQWKWDHYKRYTKPPPPESVGYDRPHYGGGEVAVSGKMIVTGIGWDRVCLEDAGTEAKLAWCDRATMGRDDGVPLAVSVSGERCYWTYLGPDGGGGLLQAALKDGSCDRKGKDWLGAGHVIMGTAAVRGQTAFFGNRVWGAVARDFAGSPQWSFAGPESNAPVVASPALSAGHCVMTTTGGELIVVDLASRGGALAQFKPGPFRFKTPHGKMAAASPAISGGAVFFGCDDGFLYVLSPSATLRAASGMTSSGPGGAIQPRTEELVLHQPRGKSEPAAGKASSWPTPYGSMAATRCADEPNLKPPFRVRWAVRSPGTFRPAPSATERDVFFTDMYGMVTCLEQATGRLRWRVRLPGQLGPGDTHGALSAGGRVYVARPQTRPGLKGSDISCLDESTGKTLWTAEIGAAGDGHSWVSPVLADGRVAFASVKGEPAKPVAEAWDAETGKPAWQVELGVKPGKPIRAPAGCASGGTFFFSVGGMTDNKPEDRYGGETVAIEAKTGKVLWRTAEAFTTSYSAVMAQDDKVYVFPCAGPQFCLDARTGGVLWKKGQYCYNQHGPTLGREAMAVKGYGGTGGLLDITGKELPGKVGGPEHTCSPVVLTSGGLSIVVTVGGIYVRDVKDPKAFWVSPMGFAPRNCGNPAVANGRLFINPQDNGMVYCFEPEK
jgi:outer membrane protein assembly factor BamB